jgi:glutamate/tyrosine decarboxylase-like PLP-dependent enzyme
MQKIDYQLLKYFIGPEAENISFFQDLINKSIEHHKNYRKNAFPKSEIEFYKETADTYMNEDGEKFNKIFNEFLQRLEVSTRNFHPRYFAQMTKDASIPALVGMFAASMINFNNHAYEGGPATTEMEMEVVELLKNLVGFKEGWGHLTSGGSLANLEALWAVRDYRVNGKILFSKGSHYSWKRNCSILRMDNFEEIDIDNHYRIDLDKLEDSLRKNKVMLVMANLGATGCGAVDDIESIIKLRDKYDFHLHIDAAYGGFSRSLIIDNENKIDHNSTPEGLSQHTFKQLIALEEADSITIDPHKHGLVPYGGGSVLYKDEELRNIILHTSPYTYHKIDKPNIGTFALEGSRPGAIAAACWLTYKLIPLNKNGIGKVIAESIKTARSFNDRIEKSGKYKMLTSPDLDIVCFYKYQQDDDLKELNRKNMEIYLKYSIENPKSDFVFSKLNISEDILNKFIPQNKINDKEFITLRAVLFKHWMLMGDDKNYLDMVFDLLQNI